MTFEQAFQKVKAKFDKADTTKLNVDFAIQVNMTDSDCGGTFYIQSIGGELRVEPYDYRDNTANVTLKKLDLYKILDGKLEVSQAVESGKVTITGSAADFSAAASCIVHDEPAPKAVKKTAAKAVKTTEKKETAKKPAAKKAPAASKAATPAAKASAKEDTAPVKTTPAKASTKKSTQK